MPSTPASFYGWRITAALAVTTTINYGCLFYVFAVLTKPMEAEFEWTRAQTSVAFSIAALTNGLSSIVAGRLVDRFGGRMLMAVGSVLGAACLWAWSMISSLMGLYLVFVALGLAWSAVFYDVAFTVIAAWFRRDRAFATFIITMVAGFASTIFFPTISSLERHLGWRDTLRWLAALVLIVTTSLHVFVLRPRPSSLDLHVDGLSYDEAITVAPEASVELAVARRTSAFWKITLTFGIARFVATGVSAHLYPLLVEAGRSQGFAAAVAGSVGPLQVLGRILFLPVSKRLSLRVVTTLTMLTFSVGLGALAISTSLPAVCTYVVLFGMANGAATMNRASLTSERYGPAAFGRISGWMGAVGALISVGAPAALGRARTLTGDYLWALTGLSLLTVVGALLIVGIGEKTSIDGAQDGPLADLTRVT